MAKYSPEQIEESLTKRMGREPSLQEMLNVNKANGGAVETHEFLKGKTGNTFEINTSGLEFARDKEEATERAIDNLEERVAIEENIFHAQQEAVNWAKTRMLAMEGERMTAELSLEAENQENTAHTAQEVQKLNLFG